MRYEVIEILNRADKIENQEERAKFLSNFMKYPLEVVLASYYNKDIEFDTFRALKYKQGRSFSLGLADSTFEIQAKKLYIFRKDTNIPLEKKKEILIKLLELLSKEEQDLFLSCLRKENTFYKNITRPFIKKYFPYIISYDIKRP